MRLDRVTAVVTGAAGDGIGRAIATALAREGANVAVLDIRPATATVETIEAQGRRALGLTVDLSHADRIDAVLGETEEALGRITVLVNAAATIQRKRFLDITLEDWATVQAVNLQSYFITGQWVARRLVEAGVGGSIINIASVGGMKATLEQSHYCAAKGGVIALTRAMAAELAPYGIRVNAISPGIVETDFNRHLLADPAFRAMRAERNPLGRVALPAELAAAALLLASDDGSFITGSNLVVDGGETAI
jgi:NAD(P)-dependent dehydrogenase (short-subunit alcohol dehydrogenase family)